MFGQLDHLAGQQLQCPARPTGWRPRAGRCHQQRLLLDAQLACRAGTRFLALNDTIDTARDDWRLSAFFASFKHESGNKDTSKRIRRSLRNRFAQGGVVQTFPYGYTKPQGTKSDADVGKALTERDVEDLFKFEQ